MNLIGIKIATPRQFLLHQSISLGNVILFRLQRTEQILDENRNELICMAEKKSSIERELNLIKASLSSKPEAKILENPETVQQLKSIVNKQKHIIDELRTQCTDLATK